MKVSAKYKVKAKKRKPKNIRSSQVFKTLQRQTSIENNMCTVLSTCRKELLEYLVNRVNNRVFGEVDEKYVKDFKKFAVTLHFYGPQAYDDIRSKFNLCLPNPRAISLWYQKRDSRPGIAQHSVDTIRARACEKPTFFCISFKEIPIKEREEWVGLNHYGYANVGNDLSGDHIERANEAILVTANAINDIWKYPLALFFGRNFTPTQKSTLLKLCIDALWGENIRIVCVTLQGSPCNMNLARVLGANMDSVPMQPYFIYNQAKYYIFIDPWHLSTMTYDLFLACRIFHYEKKKIDIAYLQKLKKKIGNKNLKHIWSNSVAAEMERYQKELLPGFADSAATIQFIRNISSVVCSMHYKSCKPITESNHEVTVEEYCNVSNYIQKLKFRNGDLVVYSPRKMAFTWLLTNMSVAMSLYDDYIKSKKLECLAINKLAAPRVALKGRKMSAKDLSLIYGESLVRTGVIRGDENLAEVKSLKYLQYKTAIRDALVKIVREEGGTSTQQTRLTSHTNTNKSILTRSVSKRYK